MLRQLSPVPVLGLALLIAGATGAEARLREPVAAGSVATAVLARDVLAAPERTAHGRGCGYMETRTVDADGRVAVRRVRVCE